MSIPALMDHQLAIRVVDLGKKYRIGAQRKRRGSFRDTLSRSVLNPVHLIQAIQHRGSPSGKAHNMIWALRNISFEVRHGEVVGIIGRNGAGKSTLLRVLTRIAIPDEGYAQLRGRVGSLLEVGTGFHADLTGRENVYLNGAILGMHRNEIDRKFEEIVDFAGVEKFIDTPVKYYSSGMYLRLAFAVAAHLETSILLVDEVLAVGDAEFQKKCLGKMSGVAREGRTVLFVSHDMAAIQNLCSCVILLDQGKSIFQGAVEEGIDLYLGTVSQSSDAVVDLSSHPNRQSGVTPIIKRARLLDENGNLKTHFRSGETLRIELYCEPITPILAPQFGIGVEDWTGTRLFGLLTQTSGIDLPLLDRPSKIVCEVTELPLIAGQYTLSLNIGTLHETSLDGVERAISLSVEAGDFFGNGRFPPASFGRVLARSKWDVSLEVG